MTTCSNNIDIGSPGVKAESGTIRVGTITGTTSTQTATYIAGIANTTLTSNVEGSVYVTTDGRLGVMVSSQRYKTAIAPMGSDTAKLVQLRPVTFKFKSDATGTRQYGLIAEEVAKVYPELLSRDGSGRIIGVRYEELAPMLLNEVQQLTAQAHQNAIQAAEVRDLKQQVAEMHAALLKLQAKDERVAQR